MPSCHDCGQPIQFIDGKPYDMEPALHYRNRKHIEATRGRSISKRLKKQAEPLLTFSPETSKAEQKALMAAIERAEKEKA